MKQVVRRVKDLTIGDVVTKPTELNPMGGTIIGIEYNQDSTITLEISEYDGDVLITHDINKPIYIYV